MPYREGQKIGWEGMVKDLIYTTAYLNIKY